MKKLFTIISFAMLFGMSASFAQDKIYKKGGEVLEVKVIEVGSSEIKYKAFANLSGPIYSVPKADILKITYENGSIENYDSVIKMIEGSDKRAQNIFVELGGQGLVFTANYDTRFGNKRNGIGGRVGIGAIGVDGANIVTVPVSLNYLLGEGKNFFEVGLGATYVSAAIFDSTGSTVFGTMSFMYRLQPVKSGFSFRGGFTPVFNGDVFIPYYAGISLGYTF